MTSTIFTHLQNARRYHPGVVFNYSLISCLQFIKSDNLQSTLVRWANGTMGQTTHHPSIWHSKYFFFIISYRLMALKTLCFHFGNLIKKNKRVYAKSFARFYEKKNTWKIKCFVDESFVPWTQWTSILYCRLTDFCIKHSCFAKASLEFLQPEIRESESQQMLKRLCLISTLLFKPCFLLMAKPKNRN